MKHKKFDPHQLVEKIEKIKRQRQSAEPIVSLNDFRQKKQPPLILVIEDDETMRVALNRLLTSEGYRILLACDGSELSEVLSDTAPDLIVLDIGLPWVNGFELATLMKDHHDLKNIPLIFISGRDSPDDIKRGFAVGADDYITKPISNDKVKKTIRTLLSLALD